MQLMSEKAVFFVFIKGLIASTTGLVDFHHNEYCCLGRLIQWQCIVNDSSSLSWRLLDSTRETLDSDEFTSRSILRASYHPLPYADDFSVVLIAKSPEFISNISFTVQSSMNGYTIQCENDKAGKMIDHAVNILDIPSYPRDVKVQHSSNEMNISWAPPVSSQCVTSYTVISNTTNSTITTTDTSVTIPLDRLSAGVYCVSVVAVDTANRTGEYSEEICFELTVPTPPEIIVFGENFFRFTVKFNQSVIPFVTTAHAMINGTVVYSSVREPSDKQSFTFEAQVQHGANYIVTAFGENYLGNGSSTSRLIYINSDNVFSTAESPTANATPAVTAEGGRNDPTTDSNRYDEREGIFPNSNNKSTVDVVIIVVPVVCGILLILLILLLLLFIFVKRKHLKSHNTSSPQCVTQFNMYEITEDRSSTHEMQRHGSKHANRASKRKRSVKTHSGGKQRAQTEIVELNSLYSHVTQVPMDKNRHKPDVNDNNYDSIGKSAAISISLPSTYCFVSAPEQSDGKQTKVQTEIAQVYSQYSHLARVPTDTDGHRPNVDYNNYDIIGKPAASASVLSAYCPKQTEGQTETAQVNSQHSCVTQIPTDGHEQADVTISDHHKPICTSIPPSAYCFVSPDNFN